MKTGMFGCLASSAAALLIGGCAVEHETHEHVSAPAVHRSSTFATTEPVFVERRAVIVDNQRRVVPIYRSGDVHFYTFGGRQYTLTDYPAMRRTTTTYVRPRTAYVGSSYRDVNLDDDYTVRTLVPIAEGPETVQRTTTTTTIEPEREVVTEFSK